MAEGRETTPCTAVLSVYLNHEGPEIVPEVAHQHTRPPVEHETDGSSTVYADHKYHRQQVGGPEERRRGEGEWGWRGKDYCV